MEPSVLRPPADTIGIVCPRCQEQCDERFYGPCVDCRQILRSTLGGDERDIEVAAYEPKMNVTPNAVALKD